MRVSHCTRCGHVTIRPQKPFGTRDVSGEASATTAVPQFPPAPRTVRTLMAIGYIIVAVSTEEPKPAIMEIIPVMNTQVTADLPCAKNTLLPSTRSILTAQIAALPMVR